MNNTQTFAPDGLSSRATNSRHDGRHENAGQGRQASAANQVIHYAAVNDHHGYDDGLVHTHGWASSSPTR